MTIHAPLKSQATIPVTLSDVVMRLKKIPDLSASERTNLISACNATAKISGKPLHLVNADASTLRALFTHTAPLSVKLSIKRFSNIRSEVLRACVRAQAIPPEPTQADVLPSWHAFLDHAEQPHLRFGLARFSRYLLCSEHLS